MDEARQRAIQELLPNLLWKHPVRINGNLEPDAPKNLKLRGMSKNKLELIIGLFAKDGHGDTIRRKWEYVNSSDTQ